MAAAQDLDQAFVDPWEKLFHSLLSEDPTQSPVVFLVDALDECDPWETEHFLDFMQGIMVAYSSVRLLCSSHQQVRVQEYMGAEMLQEIEVTTKATKAEMLIYIDGELDYRNRGVNRSIFVGRYHK